MKAILNYRFFRRLKKLDIKIETAINWFENQGLDKGWNCGLHDFFPETKIKGYLGMIISQHYLPMFPTIIEAESKVIPDTLYVIGKGLEESIKEFYPELSVQTAPAFRFQGVYRDSIKKSVNSEHTVLVVLYSVLEDAVKAMKFALETHQILGNEINVRWQIKPHPLTSKEKVLDALAEAIPEDWKWIDIDFHDCLDEVDVLMGSASTTCMEALARNKYVIIIGNQHGITHNPVPFSVTSQLWKLCYSPAEAGEVIMNCVSGVGKISEVDSIRENYFEPLTRDGVEKLIS